MTQSKIQPDSLFQKGTSGEYYLQVKSVTENSGKYEYLLSDADWHEYKAIANELYQEGKLLRCMVKFRIKRRRLFIENVSICCEQNLTTRTKKQKKKDETVLTEEDKEKRKLNSAIRDSWIRWFRGMFGMNGKKNMPEKLFNAIMTAASKLDFIELSKSCKSDAQFYQNGLSDCYKIAKSEDFYKTTRRKRVEKNYSLQGSPYITRKDWGSLYKPGRG